MNAPTILLQGHHTDIKKKIFPYWKVSLIFGSAVLVHD